MLRRRQLPAFDDHGRVLPGPTWPTPQPSLWQRSRRVAPEAYNVVDTHWGFGEMIKAAQAFRTPEPLSLSTWLVAVVPNLHWMVTISMRVSSEKAQREPGRQPACPTVAQGLLALTAAGD
jgi:hypothetical protein